MAERKADMLSRQPTSESVEFVLPADALTGTDPPDELAVQVRCGPDGPPPPHPRPAPPPLR